MKRISLLLLPSLISLLLLGMIIATASTQAANTNVEYAGVPPFVASAVTPNVLMMLDNSGSMGYRAVCDGTPNATTPYTACPTSSLIYPVGTAAGAFLAAAAARGWQAEGCEPNRWMAEWGAREYRVVIRPGELFDQNYPPASFDVVTRWDVIEHTPDPARVFRRGGQAIVIAVALAAGASCREAPEAPPAPGPDFLLSPPAASIAVGDSIAFRVTGHGSGAYRWTSSDPAVAAVSAAGVVRGITPGQSMIRIEETGGVVASATARVEVRSP